MRVGEGERRRKTLPKRSPLRQQRQPRAVRGDPIPNPTDTKMSRGGCCHCDKRPVSLQKGLETACNSCSGGHNTLRASEGPTLPHSERISAQPGLLLGGGTSRERRHTNPSGQTQAPALVACPFHGGNEVSVTPTFSCPSASGCGPSQGTRVQPPLPPACLAGLDWGTGKHWSRGRGRRHLGPIRGWLLSWGLYKPSIREAKRKKHNLLSLFIYLFSALFIVTVVSFPERKSLKITGCLVGLFKN